MSETTINRAKLRALISERDDLINFWVRDPEGNQLDNINDEMAETLPTLLDMLDAADVRIKSLEAQIKGAHEHIQQLAQALVDATPEGYTQALDQRMNEAIACRKAQLEAEARVKVLEKLLQKLANSILEQT